jgi:hypothetical protein
MYNLATAAQDVAICLRCQYRFARREGRLPLVQFQAQNAPQSRWLTTTQRRHEGEIQQQIEGVSEDGAKFRRYPRRRLGNRLREQHLKYPSTKFLRFQDEAVELGVNSFGKPAKILIVHEKKHAKPLKRHGSADVCPAQTSTAEEESLSKDIMRSFVAGSTAVDAETALKNLEQVKREFFDKYCFGRNPTIEQCHAVATKLYNGFTNPQLVLYLKNTTTFSKATGIDDMEGSFQTPQFTRSQFVVGQSQFPDTAISRVTPNTPRWLDTNIIGLPIQKGQKKKKKKKVGQTRKQGLVERILRLSWHIRAIEEKAVDGEVDIKLSEEHLDLLLSHSML